jgi:hypothetical protein
VRGRPGIPLPFEGIPLPFEGFEGEPCSAVKGARRSRDPLRSCLLPFASPVLGCAKG